MHTSVPSESGFIYLHGNIWPTHAVHMQGVDKLNQSWIALFPGLPRSSVSVDNNTRIRKGLFFAARPSASVYYCQRKPKNRKNGVGLGTRLSPG